jgi:hypothetical protein
MIVVVMAGQGLLPAIFHRSAKIIAEKAMHVT